MSLGDRLRQLRGKKSQADFGALLETSQPTIRNYENNVRYPDSEFIKKVCGKCGVTAGWLLFGEADEQQKNCRRSANFEDKKTQLIENTNSEKKETADVGSFSYREVRELEKELRQTLRENADLRVEVANLKHENKDLNRRLAESLTAGDEIAKPTDATASGASDARRTAPHSEGGDKPTPPTAIQDSVTA
jgi:transcriptional regulator with XRE-family HTH domain